jgi:hypothetical protein
MRADIDQHDGSIDDCVFFQMTNVLPAPDCDVDVVARAIVQRLDELRG